VQDKGRCLHPINSHPVMRHCATLGSGRQGARAASSLSTYAKSASGAASASPGRNRPVEIGDDIAAVSPDGTGSLWFSKDQILEVTAAEARASAMYRQTRHIDSGTPFGYGPMFEAYQFNIKDRWCTSSCVCLHHAAASDDPKLVRAALAGNLPFTRKHGMSERDEAGRTPAMVAAWRGSILALKALVQGSNLDLHDKDMRTVFHWASLSKCPADVFQIIAGKNCDAKAKDKFGDTCLHRVVQLGDVASCEILCQVGISVADSV